LTNQQKYVIIIIEIRKGRLLNMMTPDEIIRILSDTSFEERLKKEMAEIKRMKKEFAELREEIQEQLDKLEK
jgi:HAMP domain-containing protein